MILVRAALATRTAARAPCPASASAPGLVRTLSAAAPASIASLATSRAIPPRPRRCPATASAAPTTQSRAPRLLSSEAGGGAPGGLKKRAVPDRSSLSLLPTIPPATLTSIRQLPEVESALSSSSASSAASDSLKRASEVFASFSPGGSEHRAVLCLLAESMNGAGDPAGAADALAEVRSYDGAEAEGAGGDGAVVLRLAQSKALFRAGNFLEAYGLCREASDLAVAGNDDAAVSLRQGCAMNGLALSRLGLLALDESAAETAEVSPKDLMEAVDVREVLSMASSVLRNGFRASALVGSPAPELALAGAASYGNLGVADLVHNAIRTRATGGPPEAVRIHGALNSWRDGLSLLDELGEASAPSSTGGAPAAAAEARRAAAAAAAAAADFVRAGLHAGMAHALLFARGPRAKLPESELAAASEYSKAALKIYDDLIADAGEDGTSAPAGGLGPSMGRALCLVASCYARAGSAVTAEGLYQSAIEALEKDSAFKRCPLVALAARDAHLQYADLCFNWERRERDAERLRERAGEIDAALVEGWRGKAGVYAGLWFFGLGDFR